MGEKTPATVHGQSFASIVRSGKGSGRPFAVSAVPLYEPGDESRIVDDWARNVMGFLPVTVTAGQWTLLYWCKGKRVELYDVRNDPYELNNLAGDPALQEVKADLAKQLERWMTQQGDQGVKTELEAFERQRRGREKPGHAARRG